MFTPYTRGLELEKNYTTDDVEYQIDTSDLALDDFDLILAAPDLVVTSLRTTSLGSVEGNFYIQPIEVVVQNQGNASADPFKISLHYQVEEQPSFGASFVVDETSDVNSSVWYPSTKNNLTPGAEVTFTGDLHLRRDNLTGDISLWAIADSTAGEEFSPDYGRVWESVETNNQSDSITFNSSGVVYVYGDLSDFDTDTISYRDSNNNLIDPPWDLYDSVITEFI